MTYATAQLVEEVSYVAYYFHWPLETILAMEHPLRRTFHPPWRIFHPP